MMRLQDRIAAARIAHRPDIARPSNWMSDISHECMRYLVYARTHWEERIKPGAEFLGILEDGKILEDAVIRELQQAGYIITEQQIRFWDEETRLSGKCDGRLEDPDTHEKFLFEVKAMSQWAWERINSIEDMLKDKGSWRRHWPAQFNLYLHFDRRNRPPHQPAADEGLFILKNKQNALLKPIWVKYDPELAEAMMTRAREINAYVQSPTLDEADGHLPARISPALGLCQDCNFRLTCLPDIDMGDGVEVLSDAALLEMLNRRAELDPARKEYEKLDELVKKAVKGRNVIVGDYYITSKLMHRDASTTKASDYWKVEIKRR